MSMKKLLSVMALTLSAIHPVSALAWGQIGHETVGEIAQRNLTPEAQAMVFDILGVDPLAAAANWPDVVRSDSRFKEFSLYHFVTIPKGATYLTSSHPEKDMVSLITKATKRIVDPNATREEKMILMRYLAHLVGDVHQPLHTGEPGIMGGNLCQVKVVSPITGKLEQENIHHFWDETLIEFEKKAYIEKNSKNGRTPWFGYSEYAKLLLNEESAAVKAEVNAAPLSLAKDLDAWLGEAVAINDVAYPKVDEVVPGMKPYCQSRENPKAYDESRIPLMDEAYVSRFLPVARAQILKGGLRLAKILNTMATQIPAAQNRDAKKEARAVVVEINTFASPETSEVKNEK